MFIKEYSNSMVVFAKLALKGIRVPWNSNIIERLMGEIAMSENLMFIMAEVKICSIRGEF
jgi:hypothetical protein